MKCCTLMTSKLSHSIISSLFENCPDHLVAQSRSFWESWRKILLNLLKFLSVAVHVAQTHTLTPVLKQVSLALLKKNPSTHSCCKGEFEVIGSEGIIFDRRINDLFQEVWLAE